MYARLRERLTQSVWIEPAVLALAIALFVVQEVGISSISPDSEWAWLRRATFFATTPLFILVALHFRRFAGAWLIALGIAMNFAPMAAHGGNMPIAYEVIRDSGAFPQVTEADIGQQYENSKNIVLWKEDVRFEPLSDNMVATLPGYRTNIYSLGDIVIAVGVAIAAVEAVAYAFGFSWARLYTRLRPRASTSAG